MDRFSKYNPVVTLLFFVLEIISAILIFNPICLGISLLGAWVYKLMLDGKKGFLYFFKFVLPIIVLAAVFNMAFSHFGATVLFTLFDMNFTAESLVYGLNQGLMLGAVMMWFSNYSGVITSERFLCVFGRLMPDTALVFSMVLSFIPRLRRNAEEINDALYLLDTDKSKMKKSIKAFSALVTLTLEQSIETAYSMKSRGFEKGRRAYSKYKIRANDIIILLIELCLFGAVIAFYILGKYEFLCDPIISLKAVEVHTLSVFALLSFLPVIIDVLEGMRWLYLKQKI